METIAVDLETVTAELRHAGCVAPEAEASQLLLSAAGDEARLAELVARRCTGEPIAWLVGSILFCGESVLVHEGCYTPRPQSEPLAREAAARLPRRGLAVDLCTGTGAVAVVLGRRRPEATVLATEIDPLAARCARANGVEVFEGDLTAGLPPGLEGRVDVITGVVPYVPTDELRLLPRDTIRYEPRRALDGGRNGILLLSRALREAAPLLRPRGSLLLELGSDQAELLRPALAGQGYWDVHLLHDEEGDLRGLACRR